MKFRPIIIDDTKQELTQHGTDAFPLSMDFQEVANKGINGILHWHNEVQICYVSQGPIFFHTEQETIKADTHEGVFINSKCMHKASLSDDSPNGKYISLNFSPKIIHGYSNSQILQDYVLPLLSCPELDFIHLHGEPWHRKILTIFQNMASAESERCYGYELLQKNYVNQIWHEMVVNNRDLLENARKISFDDRQRMKDLLKFIHENYAYKLTLKNISEAAHISRGECCRLFKRAYNTTPFTYLNRYRISQSQKLLSYTDLSLAHIAQQTGFSSSSYFSECFRKDTGMTPLAYRQKFIP